MLSPHNVGLSVLLLPGFAIDGLVGAQVQLVLIAALPWVAAVVVLLSTLPWLGAKYAPLAALLAVYALWRAGPRGRAVLLAGGGVSALAYAAFHLATYESLTPYNVNLVYAGDTTAGALVRHVEFGDRVYRLWGLLIDRWFGVARWAPVLLLVLPGLLLLARGDARMQPAEGSRSVRRVSE